MPAERHLFMGPDTDRPEEDYASYRLLVDLWARENPVKTAKLLALLVTNALLIAGLTAAGGLTRGTWWACAAGAGFSLVFLLSLGRTVLFQEAWRLKIQALSAQHPEEAGFQVLETAGERQRAPPFLRVAGGVPSAYYLIGVPVILTMTWIGALLFLLA